MEWIWNRMGERGGDRNKDRKDEEKGDSSKQASGGDEARMRAPGNGYIYSEQRVEIC